MSSIRAVLGVVLTLSALSLAGCASAPDVNDLAAGLGEVDGVSGATAVVGHPGAPWNTEVVVRLFVDDPDDAELVRAVRGAAPVLAGDPTTAKHGATLIFIDGRPEQYVESGQELRDKVLPSSRVTDELGVAFGESVRLTPEDIVRLSEPS